MEKLQNQEGLQNLFRQLDSKKISVKNFLKLAQ